MFVDGDFTAATYANVSIFFQNWYQDVPQTELSTRFTRLNSFSFYSIFAFQVNGNGLGLKKMDLTV